MRQQRHPCLGLVPLGPGGRLPQDDRVRRWAFSFRRDQETPDTQLATFNFDGKAITCESATWTRQGFDGETFGAAFYGENGTLVIGSKVTVFDAKGKQTEQTPIKMTNDAHVGNFFAGIRDGKPLNAPIEEGTKSTDLCHLANIAYRTGRTVSFDAGSHSIVGDSEAAGSGSVNIGRLGTEGLA